MGFEFCVAMGFVFLSIAHCVLVFRHAYLAGQVGELRGNVAQAQAAEARHAHEAECGGKCHRTNGVAFKLHRGPEGAD